MSRPGIEPGPPAREASTLEKRHLDSLYAGYSEPLLALRVILYRTNLSQKQKRKDREETFLFVRKGREKAPIKGQETMGKQCSTKTGNNKRTERAQSLNVK
jgi:hypothetical protein